jgi:hypothetical protein
MSTIPVAQSSLQKVPWQLWVVIGMLSLEGIGNLLAIPNHPEAAGWLAAKCLFITGFVRGWRPTFVLFQIVAGMHVLAFLSFAPMVSLLNLVLMLLVASTLRYFFPPSAAHPAAY